MTFYKRVDGMIWPTADEPCENLEWALRHSKASAPVSISERGVLALYLAAYRELILMPRRERERVVRELRIREQKQEVMRPTHIEVEANVSHWGDSSVNGRPDMQGTLMPFRVGDKWCPVIRLADGVVINWPKGTTAQIHYKVCDEGHYWLSDGSKRLLWWNGGYVPDDFLCHVHRGFGDYIIMRINAEGYIEGWSRPTVNGEDWDVVQMEGRDDVRRI